MDGPVWTQTTAPVQAQGDDKLLLSGMKGTRKCQGRSFFNLGTFLLPGALLHCCPQVNAGPELDLHAYSDNLASMARGREERFAKAATAPAPYAVLRSTSTELGGVYPTEYVPLRPRRPSDEVVKVRSAALHCLGAW